MSSPFPIAILNGTFFSFRIRTWSKWSKSHLSETNYNNKDSSRIAVLTLSFFSLSLILAVRLYYCSGAHPCMSSFPVLSSFRSYCYFYFLLCLSVPVENLLTPLWFHSCCSHARVSGKTLVHEFHISYSQPEWYLLFPTVQLQVHNVYWERKDGNG